MTEPKTAPAALALDTRDGWPADLRLLIDRYPREVWQGHANLGAMAQFWLSPHDMLRDIDTALDEATAAFLRTPVNHPDPLRAAGDAYGTANDALLRQLRRHLDDEEDLIIPLILDRTEAALGVG